MGLKVYIVNKKTKDKMEFTTPEFALAYLNGALRSGKSLNQYRLIREQVMPLGRPGDPDSLKACVRRAFK
jgi:hypothetical protein